MKVLEDRIRHLQSMNVPVDLPETQDVVRRATHRRRKRQVAELVISAGVVAGGTLLVGRLGDDGGGPDALTASDQEINGIEVPDVVERMLTVSEADSELSDLGLLVEIVPGPGLTNETMSLDGPALGVDPAPGTVLQSGDPITLIAGAVLQPGDGLLISGLMPNGGVWLVSESDGGYLCPTIGRVSHVCGPDVLPEVPPRDPAPQLAGDEAIHIGEDPGVLLYAYLPPGATEVEVVLDDGSILTDGLVIDPEAGFWAIPVSPEATAQTVVYKDAEGTELSRHPVPPRTTWPQQP